MSRVAVGRASSIDAAEAIVMANPQTGALAAPPTPYASPDGRSVGVVSTMGVLFSDDFGANAVDLARWDVIDGGLGANPDLGHGGGALTQGAIGSGVTGMTDGVSGSALVVSMGTTDQAERWYLSRTIFAGAEDILTIVKFSQRLAANSMFVGLVEVDVATGIPLLNPHLAGDFTNRGGVELGKTTATSTYNCEAVADSSDNVAAGTSGTAAQTFVTGDEVMIEFHAEDIIASTCVPQSLSGRASIPSRVSNQCPNDGKAYKLLLRFKNVSAPATNTDVTIQRISVVDCQEHRVEITSGRGDQAVQKSIPVNGVQADNTALAGGSHMMAGICLSTTGPTAATTNRAGNITLDLARRQIVKLAGNGQSHDLNRVALANTTETTLIAAAASNRHEVQTLTVANRDTVAHTFDFRDTTAGTVRLSAIVPAGDTRHLEFPAGYPAVAVNTNWTVQLREAVSTTSPEVSSSSYRTTA